MAFPFNVKRIAPVWFPLVPVRLDLECTPDPKGTQYPKHWNCFHDCWFVFTQRDIGIIPLPNVYRCRWGMIRCVTKDKPAAGDIITVYLRPYSPLPWYFMLLDLLYRLFAIPYQLILSLFGRGHYGNGLGTGPGPPTGTTALGTGVMATFAEADMMHLS